MARYVIIGGVAGGATAAARLRRLDENSEIVLLERGDYVSFANCGLPYFIGGAITRREKLFLQTPQGFKSRFNIDVKVKSEAVRINAAERTVEVRHVETGALSRFSYDALVLSPGAAPVKPRLPGVEDPAVFTVRTVPDADAIIKRIESSAAKAAVVVGAGFIGLEMAESLTRRGIAVTLVEAMDHVLPPLDFEMAAAVQAALRSGGVSLRLGERVEGFGRNAHGLVVRLAGGVELPADLVVLSVGVKPEIGLAKGAGLAIGPAGGILVNGFLQTSDPRIYATGDAIEFPSPITGKSATTFLAGPANRQGRIAADNIVLGNRRTYGGSIGTAIVRVFDLSAGICGASEKGLEQAGIPYRSVLVHGNSHAGYYPDHKPIAIKILFSPEKGALLGAQAVGADGVDKRIDLLSLVIKKGGSIHDLAELEHAYAPQFSSARDPVMVAGFAAENALDGLVKPVAWKDVSALAAAGSLLLDVRSSKEFAAGTIPGAINIPVDDLRARLAELKREKPVMTFCAMGLRSYVAARMLMQSGFGDVTCLSGGYATYSQAIREQERAKA
jgi:NADPH-dependent 2,4-dienoyl-CoA reductase/sulfur reductase-like enzyme/rhodanese-related sulfurtransferase